MYTHLQIFPNNLGLKRKDDFNMKEKAKKVFKVVRIILIIASIVLFIGSLILNSFMYTILKAEEGENREFFELKIAIAQSYLSGKGSLIGHSDNLYKDYSYSKNFNSNLNEAKWIASQIELRGEPTDYRGQLKIFGEEFYFRIDNEYLQWIVDNKVQNQESNVMGGKQIDVFMHYDQSEKLFIVELELDIDLDNE